MKGRAYRERKIKRGRKIDQREDRKRNKGEKDEGMEQSEKKRGRAREKDLTFPEGLAEEG